MCIAVVPTHHEPYAVVVVYYLFFVIRYLLLNILSLSLSRNKTMAVIFFFVDSRQLHLRIYINIRTCVRIVAKVRNESARAIEMRGGRGKELCLGRE